MSTSATILDQSNTSATLGIKRDTVNFAVVITVGEDGKISKVRHTSSEKDINELKGIDKDGKPAPYTGKEQIAFEQSVISYRLADLKSFEELIPDGDERLNIINKGIGSKFNQKIRTLLIEQDEAGNLAFQPVEPTYDALSLVQEPAQRVNQTPMERALKTLSGLDPQMLAAVMAQLQAAAAAKTAE